MSSTRPKVVFDTNIFIQYLLSPNGTAAKCVEMIEKRVAFLITSKNILTETRDVLLRPNVFSRLPGISPAQIEIFIGYIANISAVIDPVPHNFKFDRDPKDEIIIDLAIEAKADFIVTSDKDMLNLITGHTNECKDFRRRFRELKIITPLEFLSTLNII